MGSIIHSPLTHSHQRYLRDYQAQSHSDLQFVDTRHNKAFLVNCHIERPHKGNGNEACLAVEDWGGTMNVQWGTWWVYLVVAISHLWGSGLSLPWHTWRDGIVLTGWDTAACSAPSLQSPHHAQPVGQSADTSVRVEGYMCMSRCMTQDWKTRLPNSCRVL